MPGAGSSRTPPRGHAGRAILQIRRPMTSRPSWISHSARVQGCLLAGALGDSLGAPIEFLTLAEIRQRYGSCGIADLDEAYGKVGAITDDTQMTLFTAEGLLRSRCQAERGGRRSPVGPVYHAYIRWLH